MEDICLAGHAISTRLIDLQTGLTLWSTAYGEGSEIVAFHPLIHHIAVAAGTDGRPNDTRTVNLLDLGVIDADPFRRIEDLEAAVLKHWNALYQDRDSRWSTLGNLLMMRSWILPVSRDEEAYVMHSDQGC